MQKKIGFSSETYHIHVNDLLRLPISDEYHINEFPHEILLMIGDQKNNVPDYLISGREHLYRAKKNDIEYLPVRIVLSNSSSLFFNMIGAFSKPIRTKIEKYSQHHYRILITDITQNNLERNIKTEESAYNFTKKKSRLSEEQRVDRLSKLKQSFAENSYNFDHPMQIMLCRSFGVKDKLQQGHHRMMLCKQYNINVVSTLFMHSTFMPHSSKGFLLKLMQFIRYKQVK